MKRFSVQDFINYNDPCFSCSNRLSLTVGSVNLLNENIDDLAYLDTIFLVPETKETIIEVVLKDNHYSTLKLQIIYKTNKIETSNRQELAHYLKGHKLFLESRCVGCFTRLTTHFLEFNLTQDFVYPTGISEEMLMVADNSNVYTLLSSFFTETSTLVMASSNNDEASFSSVKLELPLSPLYNFTDRKQFLDKMKTYLTFS